MPSPLPYPVDLPITGRKDEIVAALGAHQVVVVAGETGSGKSTQLSKICLEAGRGTDGMIGHTQPRRIAARSTAERVAEELGLACGDVVGYKVRFTDRVSERALVKLMTDGILLAELHGDPALRAYDALIIDEAHERSLNIDFILGYLKRLLPSRPDLSVVITSATIDTERFSRHFGDAPVIEVTGRAYPVEIRYRPIGEGGPGAGAGPGGTAVSAGDTGPGDDADPVDEVHAVCDAVAELCREGPGDILVFLAGEREIRDTADALGKAALGALEVLPLFGRLSSAEQHRIFEAHATRRVVLATNVAETSLTVPGTRYVVDAGMARVSRYSRRTKVQRLPIERVSQASADQRAGRCGRLGPGICVRLYSQEDHASRQRFTEPEILRTNLASVILQMAAVGLAGMGAAEIDDFPFLDPPDRRSIKDGIGLLEELGALVTQQRGGTAAGSWRLTAIGRKLAKLPLDPRLGRAVLEASRYECLEDILVIVAGLSVQDPRERPADRREAAAALHRRFEAANSDFMAYLALWDYLCQRQSELTSSQFRRLCRRELISYQRAREWQDVHEQLGEVCNQLGLVRARREPGPLPEAARARAHKALLSGLVTQVGVREGDRTDFAAPRGARFALWPASVLSREPPRWLMAAELVETSRLWARVVAPVRPQWVEKAAAHLLEWSYGEPAWDPQRGEAFVAARATLFGLAVVAGRRLELARLDADAAREMFVRNALVEGGWEGAPGFVARNRDLLLKMRALRQRARRPDLLVGDEALFDFYSARLPKQVASSRTFDAWWKAQSAAESALLDASAEELEELEGLGGQDVATAEFPDTWSSPGGGALALSYNWSPGDEDDGVVVEVPFAKLCQLARECVEWQVPGLREELVISLLRSLPKDLRRQLQPLAESAREFLAKAIPADGPLVTVLAAAMSEASGVRVLPGDFEWGKVPAHLRPTFRVVGHDGHCLAAGKEVAGLMSQLEPQMERALQSAARAPGLGWGPPGRRTTSWDFGELPRVFEPEWHGYRLVGFPALVDEGDAVSVRVFADEAPARLAMQAGTRRLVLLQLHVRRRLVGTLEGLLDNRTKLALAALGRLAYSSPRELVEDVVTAAVDEAVAGHGGPAWDAGAFDALVEAVHRDLEKTARDAVGITKRMISTLQDIKCRAERLRAMAVPAAPSSPLRRSLDDVEVELETLGGPRLVSRAGLGRLADVERYLAALDRRLDKLPADPLRDVALTERVQAVQQRLATASAALSDRAPGSAAARELEEVRWLVEELRVSFFAQSLGTKVAVSEARIAKVIEQLSGAS